MKDVGFDTFKDFSPISGLVKIPQGLIAHPDNGTKIRAELISLARQKPRTLNYGTGGPGSPQHIAMELLSRATNVEMTHVPYRNVSGAINGVLAGDVTTMFTAMSAVKPLVAGNRVRVLGHQHSTARCSISRHTDGRGRRSCGLQFRRLVRVPRTCWHAG